MDNKFLLIFAIKNFLYRKLRTVLTVFAMVIGVSTIVFLVSFGFGLEDMAKKQVTSGNAYEIIDVGTGNSLIVKLNEAALSDFKSLSDVKSIHTMSSAAAKEKRIVREDADVAFSAVSEDYLTITGNILKTGDYLSVQSDNYNRVLVNEKFVELSALDNNSIIGKKLLIDIVLPKEITDLEDSTIVENKEFVVGGVLKGGNSPSIYANWYNFELLNIKNYSQVKVQAKSQTGIEALRKQIETQGFKTDYLGDTIKQVEQVFNIFKIALMSLGLVALAVAALGMFNTLTISLLERTREIAILKITGFKRKDIMKVFLTEATFMGFSGGVAGILFGVFLARVTNEFLNSMAIQYGGEATKLFTFPVWFIFMVTIFSVLIGFVTGLFPAIRAARINSLDVIRYE